MTAPTEPSVEASEVRAAKLTPPEWATLRTAMRQWMRESHTIAAVESILAARLADHERAVRQARAEERERVDDLAKLCETVITVHENVVMDTPEDRELHDRAIAAFRAAHRAILARAAQPEGQEVGE